MSIFVWVMMGIALWHACVLVPDRFYGGLIGAFLTAVTGAVVSGFLLPGPGVPPHNPPGLEQALWPVPGCLIALIALYSYGSYKERAQHPDLDRTERPAPPDRTNAVVTPRLPPRT